MIWRSANDLWSMTSDRDKASKYDKERRDAKYSTCREKRRNYESVKIPTK